VVEDFISNECIGSYTIVDWMYQESAGHVPKMCHLIPLLIGCTKNRRGGAVGARRAPLLVHFQSPMWESRVARVSIPTPGFGSYTFIGCMYQESAAGAGFNTQ